ncbi:MAG: TRAP transporter large permease subunit [Acetobacteraceae bacterium]
MRAQGTASTTVASIGIGAGLDQAFGAALERAAAALLAVEMAILLTGVIARYCFQHPLIWSDELASVLFIWLSMLGAVLALRQGEHMAMTALISRASGKVRRAVHLLGLCAMLGFLLAVAGPAMEYVQDESMATIMSLDISQGWRAAAMPVAIGLMIVTLLLRLAGYPRGQVLLAGAAVAALFGVMLALGPVFLGLGRLNLVVFFLGAVSIGVFAGVPIAFSFGLATLGYLALSTHVPLSVLVARMDTGMSHSVLLSVPLFVFLGLLIEMTGMAAALVGFLADAFGHVRGGLSYVLIAAMYLVSGISGSKAADMAAVAPVLLPEMERRGVKRGELVALLAATGAQTETIPPSLILITIGSVTGISISALFTGGLLPGLTAGLMLCSVVWWRARGGVPRRRVAVRAVGRSLVVAVPALVLPFIIRGAVVGGVATATEVSTLGVIYASLAGLLVYRKFDLTRLLPMLVRTAILSGAILLIIGTATSMAWAITQSGMSRIVAAWVVGLPGGAALFMAISILLFVVLGSVLEGIPAIVLFGPLLFPIARQVGIHEVHYAMVVILSMGIGLFAPPFGVGYYVASAIAQSNPDEGMRHIWLYLLAVLAGLLVVAAVPWISIGFL